MSPSSQHGMNNFIRAFIRPLITMTRIIMLAGLVLIGLANSAWAAPTVSLTAPGDGFAYNAPVNLTLKASAAVDPLDVGATLLRVDFYANGVLVGSDAKAGYTFAWSNAPVGSHVVTAKAVDSLGQETTSAPRTVIVTDSASNLLPTVSLTSPANNAKYALPTDITLAASAADVEKNGAIAQVEFLANGQVVGTTSTKPYSVVWSNPPAGVHSLTARATDALGGQTESVARSLTILASNTPPTVSLGGVTAGTYLAPVSFNLTASANGGEVNTPIAQVEFLANDQVLATTSTKPYAFAWVEPAAGTYLLAARATDIQGLSTTTVARTVTIAAANTAPTVKLTAPANNSTYVLPADLIVSASASDLEKNVGVSLVEFLANDQVIGSVSVKPYSIVWSNPVAGTYSLTARATDTSGAQTLSVVRTVTIADVNAPPKVSLTSPANKASFTAPADITLSANANGPEANTPIAQVEFLADGQVLATVTAKPYTTVWSNAPLGSHVLTVRATDSLGAVTTSAARTITVTANQAPTVSLTSPSAGAVQLAPASFTLTASAADSDGMIAKVEFFNGATLVGTVTASPYTLDWSNVSPGSYSLTAVATDNLGSSTTSAAISVTVVANSAPTVSLTSPTQNQGFTAPATVSLAATAADPDGNLAKVEFFNGGALIATVLNAPYAADWTHVPQGSYSLTAVATDALGVQTTSAPVSITVASAQAALFYIQPDHLGTPRVVVDETNKVVWRNLPTSEAFGNSPPEEDPDGDGQQFSMNLRFPGQYYDKESNLNYNWHRNYDPAIGAYPQADPIGLSGGSLSLYRYAKSNPLSFTDPFGLKVTRWARPADIGPFGVAGLLIDHHWLKTDTQEAGMGPTTGEVPAQNGESSLPGVDVQTVDHPDQSREKNSTEVPIPFPVDEQCVNDLIRPGQSLGTFGTGNNCQTFADRVLDACRINPLTGRANRWRSAPIR